MSTIEGGMICTDDPDVYQQVRMLRSHGMVRESNDNATRERYLAEYPDLNPDFIFAFPAYNVRNSEIGGILGRSQLKRLDANVKQRTANLKVFLSLIDPERYRTDFKLEGSSNYAFNLILRNPDDALMQRLTTKLAVEGVEFRRGSAGGGNQLRQPYLRGLVSPDLYKEFPETDHIHFYGMYIGNFPDLSDEEIRTICSIINAA
jgi:CDP-6-deoxy-D-xylo-4-hexulose-3-dehydrase